MSPIWVHRRGGLGRTKVVLLACFVPLCGMILLHSWEEQRHQGHANHGSRRLDRRSSADVELDDNDLYAWVYAVGTAGTIVTSRPPAFDPVKGEVKGVGEAWTKLNSGVETTLYDVYFTDGRNGFAVGEQGTVISTENSGNEWESETFDDGLNEMLSTTNLYGTFSLTSDGPFFIVGENGLFMTKTEEWEALALFCPGDGQECTAEEFTGETNPLTLLGCRFRDEGNGVIVGNNGTNGDGVVILARSSKGAEDITFILLKPVQIGDQFPAYFGISMDAMGDVVVSGTLGVVLKIASKNREHDDGVNWEITGAVAPTCNDDTCGKFQDVYTYQDTETTTKALSATTDAPTLQTSSIIHQGCKHVKERTSYVCVKHILVTGHNSYARLFDGEDGTWRAAGTGLPVSLHLTGAYMPTSNTIIVADRTGIFYKSNDGGLTFKEKGREVTGWPENEVLTKMCGRNADESSDAMRQLSSTWLVFAAILAALSAHA